MTLALIIVVLVVSAAGLRLYYSDYKIKLLVENALSGLGGGRVSIDDFRLEGWLTIHIGGLKIEDTEFESAWLEISSLDMEIDPGELFSRKLFIKKIIIEGGKLDYERFPSMDSSNAVDEPSKGETTLPVAVFVERFSVSDLVISGPEFECAPSIEFGMIEFNDLDDYSFTYAIRDDSGRVHYHGDSLRVEGQVAFSIKGSVSDSLPTKQEIMIRIFESSAGFPDEYDLGQLELTALATSEPGSRHIAIDSLGISLNDRSIIRFVGNIDLSSGISLAFNASGTVWQVSDFADLANRLRIPLKTEGKMRLSEGRFMYSGSSILYDFTLDIEDIGLRFGEQLLVSGINGQVFSDGDLGQIVFGSSLTIDSVLALSPDGSVVRLKGLSAAVESEISESDYSLNITSGIVDFLGGRLDFSAFSENSSVSGELRISDINLAKVSSEAAGYADTMVFGLLDLRVDIGGALDSISSALRADARNVIVIIAGDTLELGDQGLEINSLTSLEPGLIKTSVDFVIGPLIKGIGALDYPLEAGAEDSLVVSYDMDIDNSLIPSYFPIALSRALGNIDISGSSSLSGRLASSADSISLQGRTDLSILPTDLLAEDFRSLLFQLVSASEIEVSPDSVSVSFKGDIDELYAEDYSDLPFPDVHFRGDLLSVSDSTWTLSSFAAEIPSHKMILSASGQFGASGDIDYFDLDVGLEFSSDEPVPLNSLISAVGSVSVRSRIKQFGDLLEFSGSLRLDSVTLTGMEDFYCGELNGEIPFYGKINLYDSLFVVEKSVGNFNRSSYRRIRRVGSSSGSGMISADVAAMGNIAATNLEIDILFRDGALAIPSFTGEILGGTFGGGLSLDFREVNLLREYPDYEKLMYKVAMEAASLDFNQLVYGFGPHEGKADLTCAAYFNGRGILMPGEDYDIDGRFHISRMGPEVLDRIFDFIDPENQNPGVIQTRGLLNKRFLGIIDMSYKPKEFVVEIKHGSLYPGLYMSQPFYASVIPLMRIPMPIRYGRIPLDIVLTGTEERK